MYASRPSYSRKLGVSTLVRLPLHHVLRQLLKLVAWDTWTRGFAVRGVIVPMWATPYGSKNWICILCCWNRSVDWKLGPRPVLQKRSWTMYRVAGRSECEA